MRDEIRKLEPTSEQCSANEILFEDDQQVMFACWYPQMGGYGGRCIITATKQPSPSNNCFDALIWHDGEFPFSDRSPIELHHCGAEQFIEFGETVARLSARDGK